MLLKHIFITGGSSGIGLSIAEICVTEFYPHLQHLTILARDQRRLEAAQKHLEQLIEEVYSKKNNAEDLPKPKVHIVSVDVSVGTEVSTKICEYIQNIGTPTMLFNNAGAYTSGTMVETDAATYQYLMDTNYLGSIYITKAFLPRMKQQNLGSITFTSSAAGQIGLFGCTAYSPTKFALRGLAEALAMEVRPHNISVTVAYPPDTDTPGYKREAGKRPKETSLICRAAGLLQPKDVARKMVLAAVKGYDSVWFGFNGWILNTVTAGMAPVTSYTDALAQVFLMSVLRLLSFFYLMEFHDTVLKCKNVKKI